MQFPGAEARKSWYGFSGRYDENIRIRQCGLHDRAIVSAHFNGKLLRRFGRVGDADSKGMVRAGVELAAAVSRLRHVEMVLIAGGGPLDRADNPRGRQRERVTDGSPPGTAQSRCP